MLTLLTTSETWNTNVEYLLYRVNLAVPDTRLFYANAILKIWNAYKIYNKSSEIWEQKKLVWFQEPIAGHNGLTGQVSFELRAQVFQDLEYWHKSLTMFAVIHCFPCHPLSSFVFNFAKTVWSVQTMRPLYRGRVERMFYCGSFTCNQLMVFCFESILCHVLQTLSLSIVHCDLNGVCLCRLDDIFSLIKQEQKRVQPRFPPSCECSSI